MLRFLSYLLPLAVFIGIAVLSYFGLQRKDPAALESAMLGKHVPTFRLEGMDKDHPGLASTDLQQGSVTLVNFFASWCVPCRVEQPQLVALARKHGAVVHGIAYKDKAEDAAAMFAKDGNPFTRIGMDTKGRVGIDWGISGVPETFVVRGDGVIVYRHVGEIRPEQIESTFLPLLRDLAAKGKS